MKNKNFKKRIKNLYKRWNIELPSEAEKFKEFKNRVLLILDSVLAEEFIKNKNLEDQFLKLIGKYYPRPIYWAISISFFKKFEDSSIYKVFSEETNFFKFIKYLQVIFWLDIEEELKNTLYVELKDAIEISLLDIEIRKTKDGEIILYPKGAKLLDEGLINDVLDWIKEKPKVYKNFKNALEKYLNKKYERNLIDDLRLSLELLLKEILKKDRVSLKKKEDQKLILKELKNKGYRVDVRNMIRQLFIYYESYQNEYVKHNDKVNPLEIEFMIYLTGCFIRLLNR